MRENSNIIKLKLSEEATLVKFSGIFFRIQEFFYWIRIYNLKRLQGN